MRKFVLTVVLSLFTLGSATMAEALDLSCLTGADPSVAEDAGDIVALEDAIATECPCAGFDGSDGNTPRDYKKCVVLQIKAAKKAGTLRAPCKGRVTKAYKAVTCGYPEALEKLPCIETATDGRRRCLVMNTSECIDEPGEVERVFCPSMTRCVDAADTNGDYLVNADDSGECIEPTTTTTTTTLEPTTTTLEPTTTTLEEPTTTTLEESTTTTLDEPTTTTLEPTTTTTMPEEVWTHCANEFGQCSLPGNRAVRFGPVGGPYVTRNIRVTEHRSTVECSTAIFGDYPTPGQPKQCEYSEEEVCVPDFNSGPHVMISRDAGTEEQEFVKIDGNRAFGEHFSCDPNSGCILQYTMIAIDPHTFAVSDIVDSRVCNPGAPSLSYHWQIYYPLGLTNPDIYASQGITGYFAQTLALHPNALPNMDESTNPDQYWRMVLRVREEPRADIPASPAKETVYIFRFLYEASAGGLTLSANCQTRFAVDSQCMFPALLRATEPF